MSDEIGSAETGVDLVEDDDERDCPEWPEALEGEGEGGVDEEVGDIFRHRAITLRLVRRMQRYELVMV